MNHNRKVAIVGLGYVGLPIAVAFGKKRARHRFRHQHSPRRGTEVGVRPEQRRLPIGLRGEHGGVHDGSGSIARSRLHHRRRPHPGRRSQAAGSDPARPLLRNRGPQPPPGSIVVYESTVYPGATEEVCVPILEKESGFKCGREFKIGYSPERINPGDHDHTFTKILKVVSGQDAETLEIVADVYASVVKAGVHKAASIKVAEAAKVIENTQRDLNIALINELAIIFHRMGIDTNDVLEAAGTKWNFLKFSPGLVGGHCIGVDPYYLTHKAEQLGYIPQVILSGRRINDGMGVFVAKEVVKRTLGAGPGRVSTANVRS